MRIAFVTAMAGAPWGGSEELWCETALRARAAGHEVFASVYRWNKRPAALERLTARNVRCELRSRSRLLRRARWLAPFCSAFGALRAFDPDVVCVSQGGTYDVARSAEFDALWRLHAAQRWPYALLCHCEQAAPRGAHLRRAREVFANASLAGFLAPRLIESSKRDLGLALDQARVFQNPLRSTLGAALDWPATASLRLASVARLEPVKGLDRLLATLDNERWRTRDWSLEICGTGPERARLEREVKRRGLEKRVRFLGFVTDIAGFWRDRQLLVLPSRDEGVPLAMQEAMLLGRPVIASNVGGIGAWIDHGDTGWLLPGRADDSAHRSLSLEQALDEAWRRRGELPAMGRAARAAVAARLDPDPAGTLLDWLGQLAVARPAAPGIAVSF